MESSEKISGLPIALILLTLVIAAYFSLPKTRRRKPRPWSKTFSKPHLTLRRGAIAQHPNSYLALAQMTAISAANFKTIPLLNHQNAAFMRDAIKREVIRKAGATWVETTQDTSADTLRDQITAALNLNQAQNRTQRPRHAHPA